MSEPRYRAGKRLWSAEDDERMRREYPDTPTAELAQSLGRSICSVYNRARNVLNLTKSEAYLSGPHACRLRRGDNVGAGTQFKPGQTPKNKGLRRPGWYRGRMRETQFKRGEMSGQAKRRWKPVGTVRVADGYPFVKVADVQGVPWTVNWKLLHVIEWERANGRMLDRAVECLRFKDGNRLNVELDNLELIPRGDHMRRNSVHNLPKPLVETIQLLGALNRKIRRHDGREKQDQRPA